jgi:hypothetical protein
MRTYFPKIIFKKKVKEIINKIPVPSFLSEKISQKKPAQNAEKIALFLLGSSKRTIRTWDINIRLGKKENIAK